MTNVKNPPVPLSAFYLGEKELLPPVPSGCWTHPRLSRLRVGLARLYWRRRDPAIYLKCLCAEALALLSKGLQLSALDRVQAPQKCDVLSTNFRQAALAAVSAEPVHRYLSRFSESFPAMSWSGGKDSTQAVISHVTFIWASAMAVSCSELSNDPTTEENVQSLRECVPVWTLYVESLIALQNR